MAKKINRIAWPLSFPTVSLLLKRDLTKGVMAFSPARLIRGFEGLEGALISVNSSKMDVCDKFSCSVAGADLKNGDEMNSVGLTTSCFAEPPSQPRPAKGNSVTRRSEQRMVVSRHPRRSHGRPSPARNFRPRKWLYPLLRSYSRLFRMRILLEV